MKSLLLLGSNAPHVHLRLRKRLTRCTLDCGFKTSESPALRGFVGGPRALATAALYLVLLSNGLRHSKNLPEKFGFSPIETPANIAKKLPPQRCFKPLFIAFSTSLTNGPRLPSPPKAGTHTRPSEKNRTQRLTRRNRAFPSAGTAWLCAANRIALNAAFATPDSTVLLYTYISRFSVNPHYQQTRKIRQSCRHKFYPQLFLVAFSTSRTNGPRSLSRVEVGTHTRLSEKNRTQRLTRRNRGRFGWGWYHYPRSVPHVHEHPRAGIRTASFTAFGSWSETFLKNAESLRSSDALMRVAVPKASRPRWAAQSCCYIYLWMSGGTKTLFA